MGAHNISMCLERTEITGDKNIPRGLTRRPQSRYRHKSQIPLITRSCKTQYGTQQGHYKGAAQRSDWLTCRKPQHAWWRHQMETLVSALPRWPMNSPHKGQWRGALMFSFICAWVNNGEAGDLRRHRAHYDVTVMFCVVIIERYRREKANQETNGLPTSRTYFV